MFTLPAYGGNRDGVGWKLIGFEDQHVLSAAVRLLRSRLSGLRRRAGEDGDERDAPIATPRPSTSSSSVPAPPAASSRASWRRQGSRSWCWNRGRGSRPEGFEHDELKYWFLGGITNDAVEEPADVSQRSGEEGDAPEGQATALVRTRRGRREPALHGELLALSRDRLHRAQRARRDPRHRLRRLADHLRRSRAVLHEGRVGDRRVGSRRRQPLRSAAHQALSDAAAAGEVVRRAPGARRAQAGPASDAGADGDQLACRTAAGRRACIAASVTASPARWWRKRRR